jgi:osmotically inducible lipoprotein OsmB
MNPIRPVRTPLRVGSTLAASVLLSMSLMGCASMSDRDRNTAVGAAIGGVAGSVLTGGSAVGTVGGAAVGGVIGNQTGRKK